MLYCVCSERSVLLNKNYQMFSQRFLLGVCVGGGGGGGKFNILWIKNFGTLCQWAILYKKSGREKIAIVGLCQRATVSKLLFKKSYMRSNSTFALLLSKTSDLLNKICCFHHVFIAFPLFIPFYTLLCPRANRSCCSSLFKKEWLWANRSSCSLKNRSRSRSSLKKCFESESLFEWKERMAISLFRSQKNVQFAQKTKEQIPNSV